MCIDVAVKLYPFYFIAQSDMAGILPHMKNYKCRSRTDCFHYRYNSSYSTLVNIQNIFCNSRTGLSVTNRCTETRSHVHWIGSTCTCLSHKPSLGREKEIVKMKKRPPFY